MTENTEAPQEMQTEPAAPPAPYAAGTGSTPVAADRAAFERMGYRERLALKKSDPQTYAAMKEA